MIISKTPYRVSLFGGSTDYESFYKDHGSLLIGFAMNQYCYLTVRKTPSIFGYHTRVLYSKIEEVINNKNILHNGVRGVLEYLNIEYGLEINHLCDLPSQTGIGSSSSFVVGLLNAILKLENKKSSKEQLSRDAIYIERKLLQESGGIQDQIWAAYGGFNCINIEKDGSFDVLKLKTDNKFITDLFDRSILLYTGSTRHSFEIAQSYDTIQSIPNKLKILDLAQQAYKLILKEDLNSVAELLHETWTEKQKISPIISNSKISEIYLTLQKNGMIGGKLLGAGGNGFLFCIMDSNKNKKTITKKFNKQLIDINISHHGSIITSE